MGRRERNEKKEKQRQGGKAQYKGNLGRFKDQVGSFGLRIIEVEGDGNCLFRSLMCQLYGIQAVSRHRELRMQAVNYMVQHREDFEPFMEDDEKWDDYIDRIQQDGEWGGQLELTALSRALKIDITIHHLDLPRFELRCGSKIEYHVSYHDGEHYNALRLQDESEFEPAKSIRLNASSLSNEKGEIGNKETSSKIKIVQASTGCMNDKHIASVLEACENDIDACIEVLIAEKNVGDSWSIEEEDDNNDNKTNKPISKNKNKIDEHNKKETKKDKKEAKRLAKAQSRKNKDKQGIKAEEKQQESKNSLLSTDHKIGELLGAIVI